MTDERPVPVKTILVTIGLVVAAVIALYLIRLLAHIWMLLLVALFFAVLLTPPVDFVRRHLRVSKGLATTLVILFGLGLIMGMMYAFIRPLVDETRDFVDRFPTYVSDARAGRGPVGRLVREYDLDKRLEDNRERLNQALEGAGGSAVDVARRVFAGLVSTLTIIVLAVLMILYGPAMLASGLGALSPPRRERVRAVAVDCARALTGYAMGNLLISLIAGSVTFIALWVFGVPFRGVLALFVAFADLIPLVGATLGAIPTILVSFLHSTTAGIGMLIVYIVYQQFENHVLQVAIMSKTVHINQLVVLVSVLMGVELLGFLGALLAIPVAGVLQVIVRDLWDHRAGRLKEEPTVGADEVPVSEVVAEREADAAPAVDAPTEAATDAPAEVATEAPVEVAEARAEATKAAEAEAKPPTEDAPRTDGETDGRADGATDAEADGTTDGKAEPPEPPIDEPGPDEAVEPTSGRA
jgi:predicted PurR-regulated permease PerM